MKIILGLLLVLVGIMVALYVGFWLCFIGGIVDVIEQIRAESICAMTIAIGIVKIIGANFIGAISAFIFVVPGIALLKA